MVLGYFVKGLTYPESLYHSTTPYSFFYYQYSLAMPFWMWMHVDHEWLADLYGLSFDKASSPKGLDPQGAWNEYLNRVTGYLKKGVPVQTYLGWAPKEADEKKGKIVTSTGLHAYWLEGLSKKTRPDTHSFVVVGIDRANDIVWFNAPAAGWRGLPKYAERPLSRVTHTMRNLRPDLKYKTMAYLRTGRAPKDRKTIEERVRKRIVQKLKGDPEAYVENPPKRYLYGVKALKGLKADLTPDRFVRIIDGRMRKRNVPAVEVPVGMKLAFYQHKFMASLAAEYLESQRRMEEWEWLSKLAILYERLYIDSVKLVTIVMSTNDKNKWREKSAPILKEMRRTIDETIKHMQQYLRRR